MAHTEDLLQDISQIDLAKELGLVLNLDSLFAQLELISSFPFKKILFCWGDDNNCKDTIKFLKEKGLHAIIYDKVDLLIDSKVIYHFFIHRHSIILILRILIYF